MMAAEDEDEDEDQNQDDDDDGLLLNVGGYEPGWRGNASPCRV